MTAERPRRKILYSPGSAVNIPISKKLASVMHVSQIAVRHAR